MFGLQTASTWRKRNIHLSYSCQYEIQSCALCSTVETTLWVYSITRHNGKHNNTHALCAPMYWAAFQNLMKRNIHRFVLHLPTGSTKLWICSITRHNGKHNNTHALCAPMYWAAFQKLMKRNLHRFVLHLPVGSKNLTRSIILHCIIFGVCQSYDWHTYPTYCFQMFITYSMLTRKP
jgi:hypothetical protein